jgi:hypothetical protein
MGMVDRMVYAHVASVRQVAGGLGREYLLRLAREQHAFDGSVFDDHEPFLWRAEISSTRLDSYYTHMAESTLQNFARMAADGVAFQNSHHWNELPLGRSLTGLVEQDGDERRVVADFYTLSGLQLNGVSTDDFITGVRSGIIHDVSVGFYGGKYICDICGRDYLSWDCPHWAGREYEVGEGEGKRTQVCTARIENAELVEVSAVYDGATPGAAIVKAEMAAERGRLSPAEYEMLETQYRIRLPRETAGHRGREVGTENTEEDLRECEGLPAGVVLQRTRRARALRLIEAELV